MGQNEVIELQDWQLGKDKMLSDMGKVFDAAIELEKRIQVLQNMLNESQWLLGEEKARSENLESDLRGAVERCHCLRTALDRQMSDYKFLQQELQDTQWFLGEERARNTSVLPVLSELAA